MPADAFRNWTPPCWVSLSRLRTTRRWKSTPPDMPNGPGAATASLTSAAGCSRCDFGVKKTLRASEQLRADVVATRAAFQVEIQQVAPEDLVFIDESGITTQMVRRFARAQ